MTKEQIDAIRARLDMATPDILNENKQCFGDCCRTKAEKEVIAHAPTDLRALLDEVERMKAREESLVTPKLSMMQTIMRLQVQVQRMAEECEEEFNRGAEAMREAAARRCEVSPIHDKRTTTAWRYADAVRALPLPKF